MFSFYEEYFNKKYNEIGIDEINCLKDEKLFVTVGGGIGSGKTYCAEKYISLPIIDVDDFVRKVGNGVYNRSNLSEGRKLFNLKLESLFKGNESFVHMGTNANLNGTTKRLLKAKENGFTSILVLVNTDINKTIQQISERIERNDISIERIKQSHNDAFKVFESLKENKNLVDFIVYVK